MHAAPVLQAISVLYTIKHRNAMTIVMCFKVLLLCELFSMNVSQALEEGQRAQSLRVFDLYISSHCLDQAHETLQLWCNVIWGKRERDSVWRETDRQRERDMTLEQHKPNPAGHTVSALTHHFISVSDTCAAATVPYQTTKSFSAHTQKIHEP